MNIDTTPRLILREMTEQDLPAVSKLLHDPDTICLNDAPDAPTDASSWLRRQLARYQSETFSVWAIQLTGDASIIGFCGLQKRTQAMKRSLEIRYYLNPEHRQKGYATEAVHCCLDHAFNKLSSSEVFACISSENRND